VALGFVVKKEKEKGIHRVKQTAPACMNPSRHDDTPLPLPPQGRKGQDKTRKTYHPKNQKQK